MSVCPPTRSLPADPLKKNRRGGLRKFARRQRPPRRHREYGQVLFSKYSPCRGLARHAMDRLPVTARCTAPPRLRRTANRPSPLLGPAPPRPPSMSPHRRHAARGFSNCQCRDRCAWRRTSGVRRPTRVPAAHRAHLTLHGFRTCGSSTRHHILQEPFQGGRSAKKTFQVVNVRSDYVLGTNVDVHQAVAVIVHDPQHSAEALHIKPLNATDDVSLALANHEFTFLIPPRSPESHIRHTLDNQECAPAIHAHHLDFRGYRARILVARRHSARVPQTDHQVVPVTDDVRRMRGD